MKKIFAIALAIIMTLSVVLGCSNSKKETPSAVSQTKITETAKSADNSNTAKDHKEKKKDKQQKQDYQQKQSASNLQTPAPSSGAKVQVEKGRAYTDKDHVAAYIHVYKTLPPNYITKGQAT